MMMLLFSDGAWHMVIAPRSSEKSSDQQDQLDGEFCTSLPRVTLHFQFYCITLGIQGFACE